MWGLQDNGGFLLAMIKESRIVKQWIEIEGKLYAPDEVEANFEQFRRIDMDRIVLKDPLKELEKADRIIQNKIDQLTKRRQEFVDRLKKYGAM